MYHRIIYLLIILLSSFSVFAENPLNRKDSTIIVFAKSNQTLGNTRTFGLAIEDVNMDNYKDIFITNYIGLSKLWLNDSSGTFIQSSQNFNLLEVHDVGIADLNGDTYPDIFLLSHASPSKVYFNDGSGIFTIGQQNIGSATDYPGKILLDDVDNDNDVDAFISYYQNPNRLWLNDGNGFFTITNTLFGADSNSCSIELMDFNGDTLPDLFLCMCSSPDQVWLNDGSGNYSNTGQSLGSDLGNDYADSKDLDGDGDNDVLVANTVEGIKIWLNQNNTGTFVEAGNYFAHANARCKLFDADLDGDFDLIATRSGAGNLLLVNDGSGNYTTLGTVFGYSSIICIESEDLDGDGDYDVVFGQGEGTGGNSIYYNESTIVGVNKKNIGLIKYKLYDNYPNPFNPATKIKYQIPKKSFVKIKVYDVLGNDVTTLVEREKATGNYEIEFDARLPNRQGIELTSGIYFYQLQINSHTETKKMLLIK